MRITIINTDGKYIANRGIEDLILNLADSRMKMINYNGMVGTIISDRVVVEDGEEGRVIILDVVKGVQPHPSVSTSDPLSDNLDRVERHNVNPANRPSLMQEVASKLEDK